MKQMLGIAVVCASLLALSHSVARAQDAAAPAAAPAVAAAAPAGDAAAAAPAVAADTGLEPAKGATKDSKKSKTSMWAVISGSGWLGTVLWLGLFGSAAAAVYFIVDCSILIKPQKIMAQTLVDKVTAAMAEGDVLKALKACESEPGPLASILSAGFSHVEEGYDIIQEAISTAADIETERLMQRLTWISVCANIAPMLGLLGTVQGMIMAFEGLATGAPDVGALALAISQALWTTAAGLCVAIPAVTFYFAIRNNANRIILRMQAMTFELIKDLRNVEVVDN
ncbi:MAG: MotA/TolQ/ExbB proton channel family protein [Kiritimatiellae bacterium]|nr:MotA/TolQ/ExbB proton channel family protein [Kiritimatiellia bacterium]